MKEFNIKEVTLALEGITLNIDNDIEKEISCEILERPYYKKADVYWEKSSKKCIAKVEVEDLLSGKNEELLLDGLCQDFMNATISVISSEFLDDIRVDVLEFLNKE
ncbi:MAG: hypothetical protein JEZ06_24290 [Anaerolineaceae bacterium]|nr:hypothetical protein [Anaerolineaceae bacterium]